MAGLLIAGLVALVIAPVTSAVPAEAQLATDFAIGVSTGTILATGESSEVVVSIDPGESAIAAIGATVTIDSSAVLVSECVALVGLGVCNAESPGVVNLQTVDPAGWTSTTDLFRLTFDSQGLTADAQLHIVVLEAFDVGGTQIAGDTIDGALQLSLNGDVDCDGIRSVGDALIIAQFVVGLRTTNTCPLPSPTTQINLTYADVTGDDVLDIGDALQVARCTVGLLDCDA